MYKLVSLNYSFIIYLTIDDTGLVGAVGVDADAAVEVHAVVGRAALPPVLRAVRLELTRVRCLGIIAFFFMVIDESGTEKVQKITHMEDCKYSIFFARYL